MSDAAAEWVPLASLKPWDKNPRKNDHAVQRVTDSIRRFGFGAPLVARKESRVIIAGHTRYKAAQMLGLKTVPVRFMDISEADSELLALADNKLGEIAEWDEGALASMLSERSFADAAFAGWSGKELGDMADAIIGAGSASIADVIDARAGYAVVVECADEGQQSMVLEFVEAQGLKCRALF